MNSLISIITVTYNAQNIIEKTIQSIINQSYSNIELIVIDGQSKDDTLNRLKLFRDRISNLVSEPDKGIYDAMNKGIDLCNGEWVIFMNAGDTFVDNNVLSDLFLDINYDNRIGVIYGDTCLNYPGYGTLHKSYGNYKGSDIPMHMCHQSAFIRLNELKKEKYDLNFRIAADVNSFNNMYHKGVLFHYVKREISLYECIEGLSTKRYKTLEMEYMKILGIKKGSIDYFKRMLKVYIKTAIQALIVAEKYELIQYKRMSKKLS